MSDDPVGQRLRSASRHPLVIVRYRLSTYDQRALSVVGLCVWNSLPVELRHPNITAQSASAAFITPARPWLQAIVRDMAVLKVFSVLEKKLDACQQWCLRRLLCISHFQHVTNIEVPRRTKQTQLSTVLYDRRLRLFGHVSRLDTRMNHSRALRAYFRVTSHWRRPPGRPRQSWTRTIENDLCALSIGLHTAWRWAQDREQRRRTVEAAMLQHGARPQWWRWCSRSTGVPRFVSSRNALYKSTNYITLHSVSCRFRLTLQRHDATCRRHDRPSGHVKMIQISRNIFVWSEKSERCPHQVRNFIQTRLLRGNSRQVVTRRCLLLMF